MSESDDPEVVVFSGRPEVLSGLLSFANFDRGDPYGVVFPMGAGCRTIILYPWPEQKDELKVVLGNVRSPCPEVCASRSPGHGLPGEKVRETDRVHGREFRDPLMRETATKMIGMSEAVYRKE